MKVRFETFGCRLNRAEALQREAELLSAGWKLSERRADADMIVVRGCSITRRAQHECEKLISHLKERYPTKKIVVEGCISKKSPSSHTLNIKGWNDSAAVVPTRTARAYLKAQDGCNGKCSFCIVPRFRGKARSVDFDELLMKARSFIDSGYREIVVTGCNLSLYNFQGKRFSQAIEALANLSPDVRIRIGSIEPVKAAEELIDVMADHSNICRFLHLPIQSGSNRTLSAMRRPYHVNDVERILKKAIDAFPLIGLGCDLITGFPGESELDFIASKRLLKSFPFSNVHAFPYSERPGTEAENLPEKIPVNVRKSRAHELADLSAACRKRYARKFIGREVEFVIEDEKKLSGWSGEYFPVELKVRDRSKRPARKELVKAKVISVIGDVLKTEI